MKVALEGSSLFFKNYTGIPYYIYKLYSGMEVIKDVDPTLAFRLKKRFNSHNPFHKQLLQKKHVWHLANQIVSTTKFDVCHSLHTPFLHPKNTLKVATVHDLAVHLPQFESFQFASDYFIKKRFSLFREFSKKADVIVTMSEATKRDFLQFFNFPEERIHVIPLAPSFTFSNAIDESSTILEELDLKSKSYFITMGGVSVRKNTFNLIKAYHLSKSKKEFKLVITGKIENNHIEEVTKFIHSNGLKNQIILTNYIANNDLRQLYINAKAFLFPTFYEGFGIPILEAMTANLPVLTSLTGAAPETAGGLAILVDAFKPESIAEGIDKLKDITQEQLQKAKDYANGHTWEKTARSTSLLYEKYM